MIIDESLFGKKSVIKTNSGKMFPVLFSQNTKTGELPYRMTWFNKTEEGLIPIKHIDINKEDVDNILQTQKLPLHIIDRMKKHMSYNINFVEPIGSSMSLTETMFPKQFNKNEREKLGSCMLAAEYVTEYLLKKGRNDFKVIEGWVIFGNDEDNESSHTWIEFNNGKVFDPTIQQFQKWGYNKEDIKYGRIENEYTPEEYLKLCKKFPETDLKNRLKLTELDIVDQGFLRAKPVKYTLKNILTEITTVRI